MNSPNRNKLVRRYGPGIWEDADGGLHFSIPELLDHFDVEDTPENRAKLENLMREVLAAECPGAKIVHRDTEND